MWCASRFFWSGKGEGRFVIPELLSRFLEGGLQGVVLMEARKKEVLNYL